MTTTEEVRPSLPRLPFKLGTVLATPGALRSLVGAGQLPQEFLRRHLACDWGEVCEEDRRANDEALKVGNRLLSAYLTKNSERIWIITEADRSQTTLLLPEEY